MTSVTSGRRLAWNLLLCGSSDSKLRLLPASPPPAAQPVALSCTCRAAGSFWVLFRRARARTNRRRGPTRDSHAACGVCRPRWPWGRSDGGPGPAPGHPGRGRRPRPARQGASRGVTVGRRCFGKFGTGPWGRWPGRGRGGICGSGGPRSGRMWRDSRCSPRPAGRPIGFVHPVLPLVGHAFQRLARPINLCARTQAPKCVSTRTHADATVCLAG